LYNTLSQITKHNDVFAWNDETPSDKTYFGGAHAKGFIAYDSDSDSGFILTHSVPKYP